jgi:hypothetical protein
LASTTGLSVCPGSKKQLHDEEVFGRNRVSQRRVSLLVRVFNICFPLEEEGDNVGVAVTGG